MTASGPIAAGSALTPERERSTLSGRSLLSMALGAVAPLRTSAIGAQIGFVSARIPRRLERGVPQAGGAHRYTGASLGNDEIDPAY